MQGQDHQLGAAEIQDVNVFTHLLSASPWMLWFLNPADESGFVDHMWNNVWRRQVVATSVGLALIVAVLALAVTPPSVYDDVVTLLCFILGQLIPMTVVLVWTFTPTRFQTSLWSPVASCCICIVGLAFHVSVYNCAVIMDSDATTSELPGCSQLAAETLPWPSFGILIAMPFYLTFGLHTRWIHALGATAVNILVFSALVLPHVQGKVGVTIVGVIFNACMTIYVAWYTQAEEYAVFKTRLAHRRMLADVVNERRNRYTAQEVGSRIFELIKRSNHMMVEYDENNIIKFVAPSCKTMLGYDTPELTNRDMMKYVHPGDRTAVQKELDNLRSGHTHHVCCVFRRLSRRGVLWVEMNAHIVQRRGFDPVVLGIEHMVPDQTAQDAKGVTSRSLVVAEAPENDKPIPDGLAVAVVGTVHEARNPIHAARAATSALRKVLRSHKEAAIVTIDQLDTLTDSLDQIRRLMQDVFVAFSGHPSAVTVYPHPYKLLHLLQRLCKQFQFLTSVHIKVEISAGVPKEIRVDKQRLMQLLSNAVTNAALASHATDGKIVVNVSKKPNQPFLRYEVKDNGASPPPSVGNVFAPRAPSLVLMSQPEASWAGSGGVLLVPRGGMGLQSCKRLVTAMNGKIGLQRNGNTTTLWFELPVSVKPVNAVGPAFSTGAAATPSAAEAKPAPTQRRRRRAKRSNSKTAGLKVMLVDDEKVNRRLGARMLERLGCKHVVLEDGDQVPGALAEHPDFDVVLMDIMMKRTDGAVVCKQLRDGGCDLPIVAMTGATGVRDVERFMKAGFDLVLPKPFDMKKMGRALVEARQRMEARLRQRGVEPERSAAPGGAAPDASAAATNTPAAATASTADAATPAATPAAAGAGSRLPPVTGTRASENKSSSE